MEVLSPGTAARDRGIKRELYQRKGVPEYWVVDLDARLIERWRPDDQRPTSCAIGSNGVAGDAGLLLLRS